MLFAGHLPDAADGKKHEWKATDTSDAPKLPSLPRPNPSKRAPPPPPAPSQTTSADDVDGTTTATAPRQT